MILPLEPGVTIGCLACVEPGVRSIGVALPVFDEGVCKVFTAAAASALSVRSGAVQTGCAYKKVVFSYSCKLCQNIAQLYVKQHTYQTRHKKL